MKRVIPFLPWIGALLLIAVALLCYESDLLWKVQQYNLFLDTSLYFHEQMLVPGGFLSYVSCCFVQFFYHPWLGVLLLCGWWLLLMWLTKHTFHIADQWTVLALIPVAALLVANMSLGYWHYFMKLRGYFFVPTIGTTVAVAMLWAFRVLHGLRFTVYSLQITPQILSICWVVVAAAIGYPLFGIYALAAVLLMGIWAWRLTNNLTQNAIQTGVAILCIVAVPMICYRYIYYQTYFNDIWTMALPAFVFTESYPLFYIPYCMLGGFFLLLALFYQTSPLAKLKKPLYIWSLQGVLAIVLIACVWHWWYKDENFHHELVMQRCIDQTDWENVLLADQQVEEPTHAIVMMHNIALMKLGRQLDEMFDFPKTSQKSNTPIPVNMVYHVFSHMIYYHYGLLNDCHRICMEDGVEYGWSAETLQYLARCSILSHEKAAALKTLNLLRHTLYHGKWAEAMQKLIDHPEQTTVDRETASVTHLLHYNNALGSDGGNVEKYIMSQLASQNSDDLFFQEQAVLGALWMMDPGVFWKRFAHYAKLRPHDPMPRVFQEGAYLFGTLAKMPDLDKLPFDKSVKKTYIAFMKELAKYDNQSANIGRTALYPFYGNTYYYEYYFMKNLH